MMRTRTNKFVLVLLSLVAVIMMMAAMTGFVSSGSNVSATDEISLTVQEGASIKLDADNTGIRFTVNVSKGLSTAVIDDQEGDAEVGVAVMPSKILNEFEAQKVNGETDLFDFIKVTYGKDKEVISQPYGTNVLSKTEDVELYGRIVGIKDENYNSAYKAVAYYTIDGENYVYSNYSGERTIAQVAFDYLNDDPATEDIAGLKEILAKATNLNGDALDVEMFNLSALAAEDIDLTATFAANFENPTFSVVSGAEYVTINGTTLSPVSTGTAIINVSADGISYNVKVSAVKGSVLADFSSEAYEGLVENYTMNAPAELYTEYLPSYNGEDGVLKIVTTNSGSNKNGYITVNLPKPTKANNVTLKMLFENKPAGAKVLSDVEGVNYAYFGAFGDSNRQIPGNNNVWTDVKVNVATITDADVCDKISFALWAGEAQYTIYIAEIYEGISETNDIDTSTLADGYLADYSSEAYEDTAVLYKHNPGGGVTANYRESVTDNRGVTETGVLEVVSTLGSNAGFTLILPKATTSDKIVIRMMVADGCYAAGFKGARTSGGSTAYYPKDQLLNETETGMWLNVEITGFAEQNYKGGDQLTIMIWAGNATQYTVYFSCIVESESDLASNLETGYCADYSSIRYLDLVTNRTFSGVANTFGKTIVESFDGEESVLKVIGKCPSDGTSGNAFDLALKLPKAHTGTYTIRLWVQLDGATGSLAGRIRNDANQDLASLENNGKWKNYVIDNTTELDTVYLYFWAPGYNVTIYVAWVCDGALPE